MLQTITITDLTRMQRDRVCIAGIDERDRCVRPVLALPDHVREYDLYTSGRLIIYPRAQVEFDLSPAQIAPPHIEDQLFDPWHKRLVQTRSDAGWKHLLQTSCFPGVDDIYDGYLQEGRWVDPGAPTRSLGTVTSVRIQRVVLGPGESGQGRRYRLSFSDASGRIFENVTISDLAFRAFADAEVARAGSLDGASPALTSLLRRHETLYLRLGLARPWAPASGMYGERCWLQVTGIHTFPDYLGGRSYAEFSP